MGAANKDGLFEIKPLPIIGPYNLQRFRQWSAEDLAGWYLVKGENTKRPYALYPQLGRAHIAANGYNQLYFDDEPRGIFKSVSYLYVVVGNQIYRIDASYNTVNITASVPLLSFSGSIYFAFLVVNNLVFSCFVDNEKIYIYQESSGTFGIVTDSNSPGNGTNGKPGYIAAFGNRITVSVSNSSQFFLSQINLGGNGFSYSTCFTVAGAAVFAQEDGIIRQMGVLNNTLYIFSDYITGVWSNIQAIFSGTGVTFPWKKNSTYNWNFGIANPNSLDIDFGLMCWLARNSDGLLQFMVSDGGQPKRISTKAIDTLLQRYTNNLGGNNPFLLANANGFLYQYENTIFYRMSGGNYQNYGILDQELKANCIEYSFECDDWHRCVELNGERNRVKLHVYFNFMHLVTLIGDNTIYNMSGQFYYNEVRDATVIDPQSPLAYIVYPFRYERSTPGISQDDYSEFETEYAQIDFVFGDSNINYSTAPFQNAQFLIAEAALDGSPQYIIAENSDADNQPVYMIADSGDTPQVGELTYNALFKPHIELFYSDDGGISFNSADVIEFSQQGIYSWRMRWYQLGCSRNRVYKLICVSPVPIVVLGAVMNMRRVSGGAN